MIYSPGGIGGYLMPFVLDSFDLMLLMFYSQVFPSYVTRELTVIGTSALARLKEKRAREREREQLAQQV